MEECQLKVAICDDNMECRDTILKYLGGIETKFGYKFEISIFNDGCELYECIKTNNFDIILLDIVMSNLDGIKTAKMIRDIGVLSKIIFISSYDNRIRELFLVSANAFLDKPIEYIKFENTINTIIDDINKDNHNLFVYHKNKNKYFVELQNIVYFESFKHTIILHTNDKKIQYNDTMKNTYSKLNNDINFIRVHKFFIININYFDISKTKLKIKKQGQNIPIGRKYKDEMMDKYSLYLNFKGSVYV